MRDLRLLGIRQSAAGTAAGVATIVLALSLALSGPLGGLRERAFDIYQTASPHDLPLDQVAVVTIDEATLGAQGRWPWPRERVGTLIEAIAASGAASIGLDLLFPEPDATADGARSDAAFAGSLAATPSVLAMTLTEEGVPLTVSPKPGFAFIGTGDMAFDEGYPGGVAPIPVLADAASGLGVIRSFADHDGRMRAIPLLWSEVSPGGELRRWPAFSVEMLRVAQGEQTLGVRMEGTSDDALRVGAAIVPLGDGRLRLIDVPADPLRVSAAGLLTDGPDDRLAGRVVVLAVDAAGLDRFHLTARGDLRLGADLHAIAVSQMLAGAYLTEPSGARLLEGGLFAGLAAAMVAAFALLARRPVLAGLAALALIAIPAGLGFFLYDSRNLLIDGLQPSGGLFLTALGGGYGLYRDAERRRQTLQKQFSQFLSPDVVRKLAASDTEAALAVEERVISAILVDIRSFTAMSEQLAGERIVDLVNHFFQIASEEIFARGGTIDKYMGDSVLAFWNAPLDHPGHADTAIDAAQAIIDRVRRDNHRLTSRGLPAIEAVAIVETGPCSVGNMGTKERIDYTAIGPAINMVARLEKEAKALGQVLVTGPGAAAAAGRPMTRIAEVELRGFDGQVAIFVPA